ncbi:MAG: glycosyltransferase family 2 protein [Alphaproteobacteria bacterium]
MSDCSLITIGITCFNAQDTVARAIMSALGQDWPNFEVLVVDDCSSDNSVAVLHDFVKKDARLRLVEHEKNLGAAAARNTLIDHASGQFLVFFDDDDESDVSRVRRQYEKICAFKEGRPGVAVACYASGKRVYANGYEKLFYAPGLFGRVPHGEIVADRILFFAGDRDIDFGVMPTCALMIETQVLRDIGGFDASMRRVEDLDLAVRLAQNGACFIGCEESLVTQYMTMAGDKNAAANLRAEQYLAEKNKVYLIRKKRYFYACEWPRLRYLHFERRYVSFLLLLLVLLVRHPFAVLRHILKTGPARLLHERKMGGV